MAVTTSFSITDAASLIAAIQAIDVGGTDAAAGTAYSFSLDLGAGVTPLALSAQLDAINLDTGSSLQIAGNGDTLDGGGLGAGLFIQGDNAVTLSPVVGDTLTVGGAIADQAGAVLGSPGSGSLVVGTGGGGGGAVTLAAADPCTGGTTLRAGTLDLAHPRRRRLRPDRLRRRGHAAP